jgi:hypothetical protein
MPLVCCRALGSELCDLGWYRQLYRLLASSGSKQLYCSQLRGAEVFVSGGGQVMSCDEAAGSGGLVLGLVSGAGASGGRGGAGLLVWGGRGAAAQVCCCTPAVTTAVAVTSCRCTLGRSSVVLIVIAASSGRE